MIKMLTLRKSCRVLSLLLALVFTLNLVAPPMALAAGKAKADEQTEVVEQAPKVEEQAPKVAEQSQTSEVPPDIEAPPEADSGIPSDIAPPPGYDILEKLEQLSRARNSENTGFVSSIANWISDIGERARRQFKSKEGFDSDDEAQKIIDDSPNASYTGNLSKRTADSGIMYPLKQVGLSVFDKEIGLISRFLSQSIVNTIAKQGKGAVSSQTWQKAGRVIAGMTPKQLSALNQNLSNSSIGQSVAKFARTNQLGATMKADASMAAIGLVAALLERGIYDGLDLNSLRDNVVNLSAICQLHKPQQKLISLPVMMVVSKHAFDALSKVFDRLYFQALKSPTISRMDKAVALLGNKLFKPNRLGSVAIKGGADSAKKLGLFDIAGATKLSLQGLTKSMFLGATCGLVLNCVFDIGHHFFMGIPKGVIIGGNRNQTMATPELYDLYYQKTGNKTKDFWENRKTAVSNVIDGYRRWKTARLMGAMGGFVGGYLGSVLAGALICATGPVGLIASIGISAVVAGVGAFFGDWLGAKIDNGEWMYARKRAAMERSIRGEIRGMATPGKDINSDIARLVALDIEKLERVGNVRNRIKLVNNLENIKVSNDGDYWNLSIDDKDGTGFNAHASTRYDFVDITGNRGVWDPDTNQIINVGKVRDNNGRHMVFVNSDDMSFLKGGGVTGKNLRVLSNGIVIKKRGDKWYVVGNGPEYDIFIRDTGERFTWNGEKFEKSGQSEIAQKAPEAKVEEIESETEPEDSGWTSSVEKIGR